MQMQPPKRPVHWAFSSLDDIRGLPEDVQDTLGQSLSSVQYGGRPANATPLKGFTGASVLEIKDNFDGDTYRCVYTVRFAEAVYVLHVFQKKSASGIKTSNHDITIVRDRLRWAEQHYKATYGVGAMGGKP